MNCLGISSDFFVHWVYGMFTFNLSFSLENHLTGVFGRHVELGLKASIF